MCNFLHSPLIQLIATIVVGVIIFFCKRIHSCFRESIIPWLIVAIIVTIKFKPCHWLETPSLVSQWGGMMCFFGLCLITTAQARADARLAKSPPPSSEWKISEDPFYKWGFFITAISTMIWAVGEGAISDLATLLSVR